ncbi:MAG: hypothetical protein OXU20_30190 [Myxococcales bacterium]|nr:hypothetical protein [Myxococcales bacterium]
MAGKVHELIEELVKLRSAGSGSDHFLRAHLMLNGIDPNEFDEASADDPDVVAQLQKMIDDFKRKG